MWQGIAARYTLTPVIIPSSYCAKPIHHCTCDWGGHWAQVEAMEKSVSELKGKMEGIEHILQTLVHRIDHSLLLQHPTVVAASSASMH